MTRPPARATTGAAEDQGCTWVLPRRVRDRQPLVRLRNASLHVEEVLTAPRSPWQNPKVERLIGSRVRFLRCSSDANSAVTFSFATILSARAAFAAANAASTPSGKAVCARSRAATAASHSSCDRLVRSSASVRVVAASFATARSASAFFDDCCRRFRSPAAGSGQAGNRRFDRLRRPQSRRRGAALDGGASPL